MKRLAFTILALALLSLSYCTKDNNDESNDPGGDNGNTKLPKVFYNVRFTPDTMFFSTDGDTAVAMNINDAKKVSSTIDITFAWDDEETSVFVDPIIRTDRSTFWWDKYICPWLKDAHKVVWYYSNMDVLKQRQLFSVASSDASKIAEFFADTANLKLTKKQGIAPEGGVAGGRDVYPQVKYNQIFGFKRMSDGKRGLLKVEGVSIWNWVGIRASIIREP